MLTFLPHFIGGEVGNVVLLPLVIILSVIFFEDMVIVIVGVLAADGAVPIPVAFLSLYIGTVIGDAALHSLGAFARSHPRLAQYVDHDFTAPFRSWLARRYAFAVFSGHLIPGFRIATYVASGFFGHSFLAFMRIASIGGVALVTILFSISYWFGSFSSEWTEGMRWGIAAVFLVILFFIGRHNMKAYGAKENATRLADSTAGART
jgi:membrane protein DedA with SNARE-associated domain